MYCNKYLIIYQEINFLIIYNKDLKNLLNIRKDAYKKEFAKIEIFPKEEEYGQFINIPDNYQNYFHIFLDDNKEETDNCYIG